MPGIYAVASTYYRRLKCYAAKPGWAMGRGCQVQRAQLAIHLTPEVRQLQRATWGFLFFLTVLKTKNKTLLISLIERRMGYESIQDKARVLPGYLSLLLIGSF